MLFFPLNLHAVCGLPRKGKTAVVVLMVMEAVRAGYEIYSNVKLFDQSGKDLRVPGGWLSDVSAKECFDQIQEVFDEIIDNEDWDVPRMMVLDEFSSLADAQEWKKFAWTSAYWKQMGKLGITAVGIEQNFSRIYNGFRDLVVYKYLVSDYNTSGDHIPMPWVNVRVGRQSVNDHQEYIPMGECVLNLTPSFDRYNTHQPMYFNKKKEKSSK